MKRKDLSKDSLINDLRSIFIDSFTYFLPTELRAMCDEGIAKGSIWDYDDGKRELFEVLAAYELIIEVDSKYLYEAQTEIIKYIPTEKLSKNWINYSNELEKATLDFLPFKAHFEKYAFDNGLDIIDVKQDVLDLIKVKTFKQAEDFSEELVDIAWDLLLVDFDEDDNNHQYYDEHNRWYRSFLKWLDE